MTGSPQCQTLAVNFLGAFVNPSEATVASRIVELPKGPALCTEGGKRIQ